MIAVNDLRQGILFIRDGNVYQVLEFRRHKMARARGVVNVKARDIQTSGVREFTFISNDSVQEADVTSLSLGFVYHDERRKQIVLLDPQSKKRYTVGSDSLAAGQIGYLKEGVSLMALAEELEDKSLKIYSVTIPNTVDLKVIQAPPSDKGDTAAGSTKPVTVETGITVKTPFFIKEGDTIRVNTVSGEYVERV